MLGAGFFRPLNRTTAPIYVDCADRLIDAADEGGQVHYDDARVIVREVLARHPEAQLEDDEGGQFREIALRAGQFFNRLLEAHWIELRRVSLDEHYVLIAPQLRRLLRMLGELAKDGVAELKDFTATLSALCRDLLAPGSLDPNTLSPEQMRQKVKDLLDRAGRADDQIHAVETLILQHESAQRKSLSPNETIQRMMVDFHEGQHMVCYDALQESGLLPRLNQARAVAHEALHDPFTKQRLAEGLAKHLDLDPTSAYTEAERWLTRLERQIASIPIKQRLIDGRMADFSRMSAARYRYQTEMRGRRPDQVKNYLDEAARLNAGRSFADLANEPGMTLLSPEIEVYYGAESLSRPRRQRTLASLSLDSPATDVDPEAAKDEIRRRNLNVLTPQRAARFVERHLQEKGGIISTEKLHVLLEDDLLDLLAMLAFDRGPVSGTHRSIRWKVETMRGELGTEPDRIPRDAEAGRLVERLTIERIS